MALRDRHFHTVTDGLDMLPNNLHTFTGAYLNFINMEDQCMTWALPEYKSLPYAGPHCLYCVCRARPKYRCGSMSIFAHEAESQESKDLQQAIQVGVWHLNKQLLSAVDVSAHKEQGRPTCHIRHVRQTRHHSLQGKLREYLGATFDDHTLPLYIAVMLNHGNGQAQVAENLVEFLQEEPASSFSAW